MDGGPVDRIRESAPLGDGQADGRLYGSAASRHGATDDEAGGERRQRFLRSLDKPEFAAPAAAALALAEQCFARAFAREFGLEAKDLIAKRPASKAPSPDPEACAQRIYSQAARALGLARASGIPDPGAALSRAAETSVAETFEALIEVGTLDGPGGVAVQEMLEYWATRLAHLVGLLYEL